MQIHDHLRVGVWSFGEDEREKGAHGDSANQCSGRDVAIGGWCSGAEGGLDRKDVPAPPPFSTSGFIFLRFAVTLSLSSGKLPPGRLKGKCGNAPRP